MSRGRIADLTGVSKKRKVVYPDYPFLRERRDREDYARRAGSEDRRRACRLRDAGRDIGENPRSPK